MLRPDPPRPARRSPPALPALRRLPPGRHCVCLLLHVLHSGIPPRLRHLLEAEQPVKVRAADGS